MKELLDAFWRAVAYCLHPKVIGLSLLPLLVGTAIGGVLYWFFWDAAVSAVDGVMAGWDTIGSVLSWMETFAGMGLRSRIAPLVVIVSAIPVVVVLALVIVAVLMTPAMVKLVADRRFPALQKKHGAGVFSSLVWSLACSAAAVVVLLVSLPLWFIPPLILIVPPLIWGWLTYRVMSFDVMADHADKAERRALMKRHRWQLLTIGVVTGYLGAAPTLVWGVSILMLLIPPVLATLVVVSIWLYTLVFAFSGLWFAHFCLAALSRLRAEQAAVAHPMPPVDPARLPSADVIDVPATFLPPAV